MIKSRNLREIFYMNELIMKIWIALKTNCRSKRAVWISIKWSFCFNFFRRLSIHPCSNKMPFSFHRVRQNNWETKHFLTTLIKLSLEPWSNVNYVDETLLGALLVDCANRSTPKRLPILKTSSEPLLISIAIDRTYPIEG